MTIVYAAIICGLIAVAYGVITSQQVLRAPAGNEKMQDIAAAIQEGAKAYLGRQYRTIAIVGVVVLLLVWWFLDAHGTPVSAVSFAIGAVLSGVAGYVGMNISVRANVRTAEAARGSLQGRADHGVPVGRGDRHARRRARPVVDLGRVLVPRRRSARLGDGRQGADGTRVRRIAHLDLRAARWRHLHQGGGRRRRPCRQGRGGHSRGRPPQPRDHRRQCRRQCR